MNRVWIYLAWIACLLAILAAGLSVRGVAATPASPLAFTLTQPDGSTFTAVQWGDEWSHGLETVEGYTIVLDPTTGWWVYAALGRDGSLVPDLTSGVLLRTGLDDPTGISFHLRPALPGAIPGSVPFFRSGIGAPAGKFTGTQPTLVILVRFTDVSPTYTPTDFANRFFDFYSYGTVTTYYEEVSYAQMHIVPAAENDTAIGGAANDGVVGWVNLGYQHPNMGQGDTRQLAKDAIFAANPYIDYALYDDNGNGIISTDELHLFIVAAGFEASYAPSGEPAVWANNWWTDGWGCLSLDSVLLGCIGEGSLNAYGGGYSIIGEKMGDHMSTLGVMVHELGHDIYWPDLYNTSPSPSTVGVGYWSVMGNGSWNTYAGGYLGNFPAHPTAWEKWAQGWLSPIPISGEENWIYAPPVESSPTSYLLRNNSNGLDWSFLHHSGTGEYFLAEYRQLIGYDSALPGCGILIWHINETAPDDYTANNSYQPLVRLEQADGVDWNDKGDAGDPYLGVYPRDSFNDSTAPNSRLYNGTPTGVGVHVTSATCGSTIAMEMVGSPALYVPAILKNYPPPWTVVTGEMFETDNFPKEGWTLSEGDFMLGRTDCRAYEGLFSGWMIADGGLGRWNRCNDPYGNNLDITFTYGPFSTVGATVAELTYHYWLDLEPWWDYFYVGVSTNNIYYTQIEYTGNSSGWQFKNFNLDDPLRDGSISYLNQPAVWVRFRMTTDSSNPADYEGVYLDNIQLRRCSFSSCDSTPPPGPSFGVPDLQSFRLAELLTFIDPFRRTQK